MRCFITALSLALLFVSHSPASANLSQDDEAILTRNLEALSVGWADAAAISAKNILLYHEYTAGDLEIYFNKFFVCLPSCALNGAIEHPFTNALYDFFINPLILDSSADIPDNNLHTALINPLWSKIRNMTSAYPSDLGKAMFNDVSLRQTLLNGHRLFAFLADKGAVDITTRTNVYYNYKIYIKAYPQYFSDATTVDYIEQPFITMLRAQVWMGFRESLPMNSAIEHEVSTTIGLGQAGVKNTGKLKIWNDISTRPLFIDNNGLDPIQLNVINNIIGGITPGIHNIKYFTVYYFLERESAGGAILSKGDPVNYNLAIKPDNLIQYSFRNTKGQIEEFTTNAPLAPDTWNHVVVTFDGNTIMMYVNGVMDAAYTAKGSPDASSIKPLELGRQNNQFPWLRGKLDEVKIYGRALSAAEVSDEYNNLSVSTAKLVAYYGMDEPRGRFVANSPGLGNNGTSIGAINVPGKINNGLFFNGRGSYVTVPDDPSLRLDGPMTLEAWVYYVNENEWLQKLVPGVGNISQLKVGAVTENPFPSDVLPIVVDTFSEVAIHEFNHSVDYFLYLTDPKMQYRKTQLIRQAGTEPLQYLRSMFFDTEGRSVFPKGPQEFFASISNQYFADTWHTFDLAIQRFNKGFKEPINQFLFFADVYSKGGPTTRSFTLNKKGVLAVSDIPVRRDFLGYITEITRSSTKTVYQFILDFNGNVLLYRTLPQMG